MSSIAILSRYKFASSAEEKIIRIFEAPRNFIDNFKRICHIKDIEDVSNIDINSPKGASVPSLGLSNKAVFSETISQANGIKDKDDYESHFTAITLDGNFFFGTI